MRGEELEGETPKRQMCVSRCDKRCHTEVGAPAEQDCRSLVVRNMSRRPRTETSTLVFGPVVTALLQVYRITTKPTSGECAAHTPTPALLPRSRTAPFPSTGLDDTLCDTPEVPPLIQTHEKSAR